ncbi:hypothetical protein ABPG74_001009 [Tetrahymena malaccensis]
MENEKLKNNAFCKNHPEFKIKYIKINDQNNEILKCEECALEEDQIFDYISIKSIKLSNHDHIFRNWPPVQDTTLLKSLKSLIQKEEEYSIEKIEQQFTQFIQEVIQKLEQIKKCILQSIVRQNQEKEDCIKIYNQISGKRQLQQFVNSSNIFQNLDGLKEFIENGFDQQYQNTNIIKQQLQKIKNSNKYSQQLFTKLRDSTFKLIDDFDFIIKQQDEENSKHLQLIQNFRFCSYSQSNQIQIVSNDNNSVSIIKNNLNLYGGIYFEYELTQNKTYTIRFKFNDSAGEYFIIGLLNSKQMHKTLNETRQGKTFCKISNAGADVMQGEYFYQIFPEQILEMRVNIKYQQIYFLEYPDYNNINKLRDIDLLDQNGVYYLAIHFGANELYKTCIDLIYFQESDC